jgi:hypothetical protein
LCSRQNFQNQALVIRQIQSFHRLTQGL